MPTAEQVLWAFIILAALGLRLWNLGSLPLQNSESTQALRSWQILLNQTGTTVTAPLLDYGNALVFLAFGANEASARMLPALSGTLLVALPMLLRRQLGHSGALVAALLLALSPTLLYLARLENPQAITTAAALATVACAAQASQHGGRWQYLTAIAFGLLLLTGRDAFSMLLVLLIGAGILAVRQESRGALRRAIAQDAAKMSLLVAGMVICGTTAFLANVHGVQDGIVTPLASWLGMLSRRDEAWHFPLQVLSVYEPAVLLFGLLGSFAALGIIGRRSHVERSRKSLSDHSSARLVLRPDDRGVSSRMFVAFLILWACVALVISALNGQRPPAGIGLVVVPLSLLGGPTIIRTIRTLRVSLPDRQIALFLAVMLSLLALFWIGSSFFSLPGQALPPVVRLGFFTFSTSALGEINVLGLILLLVAGGTGLGFWLGVEHLPRLLGALAIVVFGLITFHSAILLNFNPHASSAELLVPERTSLDVRTLVQDIRDASDALAIKERRASVQVGVPSPVLRWYLRDVPHVSFDPRPTGAESLVVASVGADPPPGSNAGQRYRLNTVWSRDASSLGAFWRWLTLREPPSRLTNDDVVLYIKMP